VSALTCTEVRGLAQEFALDLLGGVERTEVIAHLDHCANCQALVAALSEVADALPLLAPELEPTPGFSHRVISSFDAYGRR
jgi:putative zinc finger protein